MALQLVFFWVGDFLVTVLIHSLSYWGIGAVFDQTVAAWVQAFGSIAAIAGAAWIAISQTAKQHQNAKELLGKR